MMSLSNHRALGADCFPLAPNLVLRQAHHEVWGGAALRHQWFGEGLAVEVTVYIVRCSDGSYYTGLTKQEVEARVWEHNEGIYDGYTRKRRPVVLMFTETYDRIVDAIERERQIKGWSRTKKEALIAMDYEGLPKLARNRQGVGYVRRWPPVTE
jgi:putative endonuclease